MSKLLEDQDGAPFPEEVQQLVRTLEAVRELHSRRGIYDECDHQHEVGEPGVKNVAEVGLVCEKGLLYYICAECCCDDIYQREDCATDHQHAKDDTPACPTADLVGDGRE